MKTYVFDKNFNFLKAFKSRFEAVLKVKKRDCFYFSQKEIKEDRHIKLFSELNKFQTNFERQRVLEKLLSDRKKAKKK